MPQRWDRLRPFEQLLADDTNGTNPAIILAVFAIKGELTCEWVIRHIAARLATHPRFCSVLANRRSSRFKLVPGFGPNSEALGEHVTVKQAALTTEALNELLSGNLPRSKPLWDINAFTTPAKTDVVFRVHHVIGDGVGLMRFVLATVVQRAPESPPTTVGATRRPLHSALVMPNRGHFLDRVGHAAQDARDIFVMPLVPDTKCALTRAPMCGRKRAAFGRVRSVDALRTASRSIGVSINDLMLAALCSAVYKYTTAAGDTAKDLKRVRLGVAFNRHPIEQDGYDFVHNATVVVALLSPLMGKGRVERLATVVQRMRRVKGGSKLWMSNIAFMIVSAMPLFLRVPLWRRITRSVSLLLTNISGPLSTLHVADRDVIDIKVMAPSQGLAGVTLSAISYCGRLSVCMGADESRMSNPEKFLETYDEELDGIISWTKEVASEVH